MKNKISLLALAMMMVTATAFAQRNNDNDYGDSREDYNHAYNDNHDRGAQPDYGPRRLRYDDSRTAMRPAAFRIIVNNMRNESFDRDRMRIARYVVRQNSLSVAQIRTLAQLFSFDSYKLEFTKCAYATCVDPQNYYTLSRVFAFSSSRKALFDYIARV